MTTGSAGSPERAALPFAVAPSDAGSSDEPAWHPARRFGFRLLATYFLLYVLPFPLEVVPWLGTAAATGVRWLWRATMPWVAANVLGIERELYLGPTGSGDTTFDYVKLVAAAALALAAATIWTLVDRRRPHYRRAARWLTVLARYYLALVMLGYGIAKVVPTQFPLPGLTRLLTPYGESSPMGILWTFMGASPAYTIFSGLCETIPALLLVFRRTRLLGALLAVAVLTNVVALNFTYDVPVKLFSMHLLLVAVALVLLDARRLLAFFVRNAPVPPAHDPPLFRRRWANVAGQVLGLVIVSWSLFSAVRQGLQMHRAFGNARARPAIYGIHDVESFVVDGVELPALLTDTKRWRALVVDRALPVKLPFLDRPGTIAIWHLDGTFSHHPVELVEVDGGNEGSLTLLPAPQGGSAAAETAVTAPLGELRYHRAGPGELIVSGTWEGREIEAVLRQRDAAVQLLSRGFHWINEHPYNR